MARFQKPAEGTGTEQHPELGTGPVSLEDSISRAFYEREAIFERAWLNVGRMEQLPRNGSPPSMRRRCARPKAGASHAGR